MIVDELDKAVAISLQGPEATKAVKAFRLFTDPPADCSLITDNW